MIIALLTWKNIGKEEMPEFASNWLRINTVYPGAPAEVDRLDQNKDQPIAEIAATRLRPILVTTLTTVVGVLPTAYGLAGYDSMLAEMMLVMGWSLFLSTLVTLIIVPLIYSFSSRELSHA